MIGRITFAAPALLAAATALPVAAPALAQQETVAPQSATAADMALFAPYIGRFRSEDKVFEDSAVTYHYEIDYRWYDRQRSIVSYALALVIPEQDRRLEIGDGFYYFDRVNNRIGVFGAFPDGRVGQGTMGQFDRETHARTVWVDGVGPDGSVTQVRDRFEIIDADSWRNVTRIRRAGEDWQQVNADTYTRIGEDESNAG